VDVALLRVYLGHLGELLEGLGVREVDVPALVVLALLFTLARTRISQSNLSLPPPHQLVLELHSHNRRSSHLSHQFFIPILIDLISSRNSLIARLFPGKIKAISIGEFRRIAKDKLCEILIWFLDT
jgi:hypothetical protein